MMFLIEKKRGNMNSRKKMENIKEEEEDKIRGLGFLYPFSLLKQQFLL